MRSLMERGGIGSPHSSRIFWYPIPKLAIFVLITLFFVGIAVSLFILVEVHNASFLASLFLLSFLVFVFFLWNSRREAVLCLFLHSFPDSDLGAARDGQLVKITGPVSCGSISVESSYEKVGRCIYTSTLLYEYKGIFGWRMPFAAPLCRLWKLAYSERISTDFYITDVKSRSRASVEAGSGSNVIPLFRESTLVQTTGEDFSSLSPSLRKWLDERHLSSQPCRFRLLEGFVKEGDCVTVLGVIRRRENDVTTIVQPPEVVSTGCLWWRLLLPLDFDGLILGSPKQERK